MQFSERLKAFVDERPTEQPFLLADWLSTLSRADLTALLDLVGRTVFAESGTVAEREVHDVMMLTVDAHAHKTKTQAALDPRVVERMALALEFAVWLQGTRRLKGPGAHRVPSLVKACKLPLYVDPKEVSPAVAHAWSAVQKLEPEEAGRFLR